MQGGKGNAVGEELIDFLLCRKFQGLDHMGQLESVHIEDRRQHDVGMFCYLERLDGHIDDLLAVLRMHDDPSAVPLVHDVRMIVPDVQRTGNGTVGVAHDYGQPHGRNDGQHLMHVHQALGTGGRIDPGSCR